MVPAKGTMYVKYASAESAKMVLGMAQSKEKQYVSSVSLEMYDEQDTGTSIWRKSIYCGTDTVNNERAFEQGKTYVFKISVTDTTETELTFSVKKNTLTYEAYNSYMIDTEPGAEPVLEIKNAASSQKNAVITYQWYEGFSSSKYTMIDGAVSASYKLSPITVESPEYYRCRVSDGNVFADIDLYLWINTGLNSGVSEKSIFAKKGDTVVLDPKRSSSSEIEITYSWTKFDGSSYKSIEGAADAAYTFTMSEETVGQYKCSLYDGYNSADVYFSVNLPDTVGELPLGTDITVESNQADLYTFTPAENGFYKKTGWGAAAIYDSSLNEIDTFDLNASSYLRAGQQYYVLLDAGSSQQIYSFTLSEPGNLPDTVVKGGYYNGRIWSLDGSGVLRYSGSGSIDSIGYAGLQHADVSEVKEIVFEEGITSCGSSNYASISYGEYKNLEKVSFASSVTLIGQDAFKGCSSLREVVFAEGIQLTDIGAGAFDGTPYIAEQSGDFIMAGTIVVGYRGTDASATIPEEATILGSRVMQGSQNLENLYILKNLKRINQFAVADCGSLPAVEVPGNVTNIEYCAFYSDTALEHVVLNEGVQRIEREAFFACNSLKEITIPKSVNYIGEHAIGYASGDYTGKYTLNEELPTIKCYYATYGYNYAKNNNLPYELLDEKDISQDSPLVHISFNIMDGKLDQINVQFAGAALTKDEDYTAKYTVNGDKYKLVVTGIGEYSGTKTFEGSISSGSGGTGTSDGTGGSGTNSGGSGGTGTSDGTGGSGTNSGGSSGTGTSDGTGNGTQNHTHSYKKASTIQEATALQEGKEKWSCSCGDTITKTLPKLKATGKVTAAKVTLQVKKSVTLKVTNLAKGDYVKTWSSNNKKVATVDKKGKVKGKKTGSAKLTVTLASGKKLTVNLKVITGIVKTTKLKLNKSSLTLKAKKSYTLKCTVTPFNSQEKVTYSSSNKKIATVSSKGVIKAKKKGKAVITVKSGKKKAACKVTVK